VLLLHELSRIGRMLLPVMTGIARIMLPVLNRIAGMIPAAATCLELAEVSRARGAATFIRVGQ
jgi:hypothetical protein